MDNRRKRFWGKETIESNFVDFKVRDIEYLGEGWRSKAFLVNDEYVFRFPKEESGNKDLQKEIKVLPLLEKVISMSIPKFEYIGKQKNEFEFVGYKMLSGKIFKADEFRLLSDKRKEIIAKQVSTFMDEINSFPVERAKELGVLENDFFNDYSETLVEYREKVFPYIDTEIQNYITMKFEEYLNNCENFKYNPRLIHADLSLDHLIYNESKERIEGIIDFGDMEIGDSDYDYVYLLEECGEEFVKKIMKLRNEENIHGKLKKISFFLTVDNVGIVLEGIRIKNSEMIKKGVLAIKKTGTMETRQQHYRDI